MSSKSLTGWLLIGGPILTFLVWGLLYSALVGDQETAASSVQEMLANPELARLLLGLGSMAFVAIFIGFTLLARSMQGDDNQGSACASVAGIIFAALTGIGIVATGLSAGALETASTSEALAVNIEAVSNAMFTGLWFFWGIGSLFLGGAMLMQKNLHVVIAWVFVVFGVWVILSSLVDLSLGDSVGFAIWIIMSLVTAAAGVLILRGKQEGAAS